MAIEESIGGDQTLYVDEDKTFRLEVLVHEDDGTYDASSVPVNITGWEIVLDIRAKDDSQTQLLFETATISGTYNATRSANTQRAVVSVPDEDLHIFKGSNLPDGRAKTYRFSWKRINNGQKTVLRAGDWLPEKATAD